MALRYLLSDVDIGDEEASAVADVVRSKWLSLGPRTAAFEREFAAYMGAGHAVAISNCTAALHLALLAHGVGPGDEVLVPSYTFVASANAILYQRATPVFVDIVGPHDLNLCCDDLEAKVTPRTKAIIVVHVAGFPVDMDRVMRLAESRQLTVIEDACHAIGARYQGQPDSQFLGRFAGTIGHSGCFSFFANKNLVTGEGGMLVTDDASVAERVRLARSHGMTKSSWDKASGRASDYDVPSLGFNYRPTEMTAALGTIQLRKLEASNARRRELAAAYRRHLADTPAVTIPFAERLPDSAHHIFPVLLDPGIDRSKLRARLLEHGIQTSVHYPPVHEFSHYRSRLSSDPRLSRTVDASAREVTLPLHPFLTETDVEEIAGVLKACVAAAV